MGYRMLKILTDFARAKFYSCPSNYKKNDLDFCSIVLLRIIKFNIYLQVKHLHMQVLSRSYIFCYICI